MGKPLWVSPSRTAWLLLVAFNFTGRLSNGNAFEGSLFDASCADKQAAAGSSSANIRREGSIVTAGLYIFRGSDLTSKTGQHSFQISTGVLGPRQRVLAVDFVFKIDVSAVAGLAELLEDRKHRHHALTDVALAVFLFAVLEILHVKVEQTRACVRNLLNDVRAAAHGMTYVHAHPHARIHAFYGLQNDFWNRKILVLRTV